MSKATPKLVLIICVVATAVLAALKFTSPQFALFNSGLILVILLTTFVRKNFYTYLFGILSVVVIIAPVLVYGYNGDRNELLMQLAAVVVAFISTAVVVYIKNLNRLMEYNRKQMNAMFEYATEGILLTNGKGEIVLVNPEARRLFM